MNAKSISAFLVFVLGNPDPCRDPGSALALGYERVTVHLNVVIAALSVLCTGAVHKAVVLYPEDFERVTLRQSGRHEYLEPVLRFAFERVQRVHDPVREQVELGGRDSALAPYRLTDKRVRQSVDQDAPSVVQCVLGHVTSPLR